MTEAHELAELPAWAGDDAARRFVDGLGATVRRAYGKKEIVATITRFGRRYGNVFATRSRGSTERTVWETLADIVESHCLDDREKLLEIKATVARLEHNLHLVRNAFDLDVLDQALSPLLTWEPRQDLLRGMSSLPPGLQQDLVRVLTDQPPPITVGPGGLEPWLKCLLSKFFVWFFNLGRDDLSDQERIWALVDFLHGACLAARHLGGSRLIQALEKEASTMKQVIRSVTRDDDCDAGYAIIEYVLYKVQRKEGTVDFLLTLRMGLDMLNRTTMNEALRKLDSVCRRYEPDTYRPDRPVLDLFVEPFFELGTTFMVDVLGWLQRSCMAVFSVTINNDGAADKFVFEDTMRIRLTLLHGLCFAGQERGVAVAGLQTAINDVQTFLDDAEETRGCIDTHLAEEWNNELSKVAEEALSKENYLLALRSGLEELLPQLQYELDAQGEVI